jgi:hypothetical protein
VCVCVCVCVCCVCVRGMGRRNTYRAGTDSKMAGKTEVPVEEINEMVATHMKKEHVG